MNVRAKICKVLWMLRRPLISDGAEEKGLLFGVEDSSPTRAVAKPLRRDGVSGRNAVRCDAQKLLYQARDVHTSSSSLLHLAPRFPRAVHYASHGIPKQPLPGMLNKKNRPPYSCMIPSEGDVNAALVTHGRECHTCTTAMKALSWMSARVAVIPRIPCAGAMVVVVVEGKEIIGSNELSLNAIKVTRFRENKRSNEVTKKATTPGGVGPGQTIRCGLES
ncbi:hypothetical protein B0H13DRAFT_1878965 [Mycena leptocephala]|nr:hypothetical protein B0H13DRAFT_1878965 [Mycena leptocephala]